MVMPFFQQLSNFVLLALLFFLNLSPIKSSCVYYNVSNTDILVEKYVPTICFNNSLQANTDCAGATNDKGQPFECNQLSQGFERCGCVGSPVNRSADVVVLVDGNVRTDAFWTSQLLNTMRILKGDVLAHLTDQYNYTFVVYNHSAVDYVGGDPFQDKYSGTTSLPAQFKTGDADFCVGLNKAIDVAQAGSSSTKILLALQSANVSNPNASSVCLRSGLNRQIRFADYFHATYAYPYLAPVNDGIQMKHIERSMGNFTHCIYSIDTIRQRPFRNLTWYDVELDDLSWVRNLVGTFSDYVCQFATVPTSPPTRHPTKFPSVNPSVSPTLFPTSNPTVNPTQSPTKGPTKTPTRDPTRHPSKHPSNQPSKHPSLNPTKTPSSHPTQNPSKTPSKNPTAHPSVHPTAHPSGNPTAMPSENPTKSPTKNPTLNPSRFPTQHPTKTPSVNPTKYPTVNPTTFPTGFPTKLPTGYPTVWTRSPTKRLWWSHVGPTPRPTKLWWKHHGHHGHHVGHHGYYHGGYHPVGYHHHVHHHYYHYRPRWQRRGSSSSSDSRYPYRGGYTRPRYYSPYRYDSSRSHLSKFYEMMRQYYYFKHLAKSSKK